MREKLTRVVIYHAMTWPQTIFWTAVAALLVAAFYVAVTTP